MTEIKLYEQPILTDYHSYSRVWITEDDYFTIYKSNFRTWFWTNYQVVHLNKTILTMIGDNEPPADLIDRTLVAISELSRPQPQPKKDSGIVIRNNKVMTTQEYSNEYKKARQLSGLKRGQFNPNL